MIETPLNLTILVSGSILIGVGATAVLDLWGAFLKVCFNIKPLNFAMVGRWIGHMQKGSLHHQEGIAASSPIASEVTIGWATHYITGILFAAVLIVIGGNDWLQKPTMTPALVFGLCTVIFPFLLMQPSMGLGVAASNAPKPTTARLRSCTTHLVFGLGLYLSATLFSKFTFT